MTLYHGMASHFCIKLGGGSDMDMVSLLCFRFDFLRREPVIDEMVRCYRDDCWNELALTQPVLACRCYVWNLKRLWLLHLIGEKSLFDLGFTLHGFRGRYYDHWSTDTTLAIPLHTLSPNSNQRLVLSLKRSLDVGGVTYRLLTLSFTQGLFLIA